MRITSGKTKGYKLKIPPNSRIRPAQSIVRQAIFNIIGEHIVGARVLDLFAGSGSLGIEALSRGAAWCDFVDQDKIVTRVVKENIHHTHFEGQAKVHTMKAKCFIEDFVNGLAIDRIDRYDFVFLSPPYAQGIDYELLKKLPQVLRGEGLIIFEHSKKTALPDEPENLNLKLIDERVYGAAKVSFLQKQIAIGNPKGCHPSTTAQKAAVNP